MYSHTQFGWMTLIALLGALVALGAVGRNLGPEGTVGLIRKKIKIRDIQSATRVRNKWYYGWGMRVGPWGWMYNVSGLDAVEIELKGGGRFRVGTDEPEELERAIRQRIEIKR